MATAPISVSVAQRLFNVCAVGAFLVSALAACLPQFAPSAPGPPAEARAYDILRGAVSENPMLLVHAASTRYSVLATPDEPEEPKWNVRIPASQSRTARTFGVLHFERWTTTQKSR